MCAVLGLAVEQRSRTQRAAHGDRHVAPHVVLDGALQRDACHRDGVAGREVRRLGALEQVDDLDEAARPAGGLGEVLEIRAAELLPCVGRREPPVRLVPRAAPERFPRLAEQIAGLGRDLTVVGHASAFRPGAGQVKRAAAAQWKKCPPFTSSA